MHPIFDRNEFPAISSSNRERRVPLKEIDVEHIQIVGVSNGF